MDEGCVAKNHSQGIHLLPLRKQPCQEDETQAEVPFLIGSPVSLFFLTPEGILPPFTIQRREEYFEPIDYGFPKDHMWNTASCSMKKRILWAYTFGKRCIPYPPPRESQDTFEYKPFGEVL